MQTTQLPRRTLCRRIWTTTTTTTKAEIRRMQRRKQERDLSSSPSSRQGETNLSKLRETSSIPISHRATDLPKHQREEEGRGEKKELKIGRILRPRCFTKRLNGKGGNHLNKISRTWLKFITSSTRGVGRKF